MSLDPLPPASIPTWDNAVGASWFGFHDGLLWGSWIGVSSLATQLFHAFGPIVGDAPVSARSAALLAALLALAAVYALGHRAAGRLGAVAAALIAIAATPLRDAAVDGGSLPVLVLAGALLAYALHALPGQGHTARRRRCWPRGSRWPHWPSPSGSRVPSWRCRSSCWPAVSAARARRALGAGALVAAILVGPHLASTAAQNDGKPFADVSARAIAARNAEFAGGGHGAPLGRGGVARSALGDPVTLGGYVFGEHSLAQVAGGTLTRRPGGARGVRRRRIGARRDRVRVRADRRALRPRSCRACACWCWCRC